MKTKNNKNCRRRAHDTQVDKLIGVLSDGKWHSTKQLRRRVGNTFGVAKFVLARSGIRVERRRHKNACRQWQYRIDLSNPIDAATDTRSTFARTRREGDPSRFN